MLTHGLQKYIGQSGGSAGAGAGRISQPSNSGWGMYRSGFASSFPGASGAKVASMCMA